MTGFLPTLYSLSGLCVIKEHQANMPELTLYLSILLWTLILTVLCLINICIYLNLLNKLSVCWFFGIVQQEIFSLKLYEGR